MMGRAAVYDLARLEDVERVGIYDIDGSLSREIKEKFGSDNTVSGELDAGDVEKARSVMEPYDAVLSCVTYRYNPGLAQAAIESGCHFVDLGGNNDVVKAQFEMNAEAEKAGVVVIPDCGLAPGMVSLLVADGVARLDRVEKASIRVGGLPQSPRGPLKYQVVFSSEGLVNEYWEPCLILKDGHKTTVNPMTGLETLEFDGVGELEAFYTSGGTSTLPTTYEGKIDSLDYKTIRYAGHCQLFRAMLDIGLASHKPVEIDGMKIEPRSVFKAVLERSLNYNDLDMVLARVTVEGQKDGQDKTVVYEIVDRQEATTGLTAMMRTTAFPAAIITWMAASGQISERGVKPQEIAVKPSLFLPQLKKRGINLTIKE